MNRIIVLGVTGLIMAGCVSRPMSDNPVGGQKKKATSDNQAQVKVPSQNSAIEQARKEREAQRKMLQDIQAELKNQRLQKAAEANGGRNVRGDNVDKR